jgi:CRISPR-associated protein Cas1
MKMVAKSQRTSEYLANSNKQLLIYHLLGVAKRAISIYISLCGEKDIKPEIVKELYLAAILHDWGKILGEFQQYISKTKGSAADVLTDAEFSRTKRFEGPYHNEYSWLFFLQCSFGGLNDKNISIIQYLIYWHHPANVENFGRDFKFDSEAKIFEKMSTNEDVWALSHEMYAEMSNIEIDDKFNEILCEVLKALPSSWKHVGDMNSTPPLFFSSKNVENYWDLKRLMLGILIEADRSVSSLAPSVLIEYVQADYNSTTKEWFGISNAGSIGKPPLFEKKCSYHDEQQLNLVSTLVGKTTVACGIDPGEGKTSIGILWWLELNKKRIKQRPLVIALPRQHQTMGLFQTIQKDLLRILGKNKVTIEYIFNGKVQGANYQREEDEYDLLKSDINILVFDRLLSPNYERRQHSEFMFSLNADLILDEFHEFTMIPTMIQPLREILNIRKTYVDSRTLLLSGTPDPSLLEVLGLNPIDHLVTRDKISVFKERKIKFQTKAIDQLVFAMQGRRSLFSFPTVQETQEEFCRVYDPSNEIIHSKFTDHQKNEKIAKILENYGEFGSAQFPVKSSKMLQSSYDISFEFGELVSSLPNIDSQTLGRINRHGHYNENATVVFYIPNESSVYTENRLGFSKLHKSWVKYLENAIGLERDMTYREFMTDVYDRFWKNKGNVAESIQEIRRQKQEVDRDVLDAWFPIRFVIAKNETEKAKNEGNVRGYRKSGFRGVSCPISACRYDKNGDRVGQLVGDDLLTISDKWRIRVFKELTGRLLDLCTSNKKEASLNIYESFSFSKYSKKGIGHNPSTPFIASHIDEFIGKAIRKEILSPSFELKYEYVYSDLLGFCQKTLVEDLKKKAEEYNESSSAIGTNQEIMVVQDSSEPENNIELVNATAINSELETNPAVGEAKIKIFPENSECDLTVKRRFESVIEKSPLVPLSRRFPFVYIEYCKLIRKGNDVRVFREDVDEEFTIPVATLGAIVLGPGVSISSEAARVATSRGCLLCIAGGEGIPIYLASTQHRSPLPRLRQHETIFDAKKKLFAAKVLFSRRALFIKKFCPKGFPEFPNGDFVSIENMLAQEGAWAKRAYGSIARLMNISWEGKKNAGENKHPIIFLNHLSYSIADLAILHLGYDPNIGILHGRTKGGGLAYDLADIYKPLLALWDAFEAIKLNRSLGEMKSIFFSRVVECDVLEFCIQTLNLALRDVNKSDEITLEDSDVDSNQ